MQLLERRVDIRAAIVRGRETTPKSRAGQRSIEIGRATTNLLQRRYQASAYRGDDDLVFHHPTKGTPLDPSKLSKVYLRPALQKAEITKPFRPFHDLRHTALTHDAAAGNPAVYVQMKAGHSQAAITERYTHASQVLFPGAAQRGEDRLFGKVFGQKLGTSSPTEAT